MKNWIRATGAAGLLLAVPALADVKAGVDAWGRGDYKRAVAEWRAPAIAGDADAQFNMGQAYKLGRGVPVDLAMAEEWYRKAAAQGHPQAEDNYGLALFQNGRRDQALPWLQKSAGRGEPRAQYVLGTMFFNADIVKKDWVRAYALMTRAQAAGLPQASGTIAQMDRYLSMDERQRGTALAREMEGTAGRTIADVASTDSRAPASAATRKPVRAAPVMAKDVPAVAKSAPVTAAARPASGPTPAPRAAPVVAGDYRVQLGAFRDPDGARRLWSQVSGRFPGRKPYFVPAGGLTKLLVGPYATQADAARGCGSVSPCVPTKG